MGGGARPFLVGGTICLVNSDNERDTSLLNSRNTGSSATLTEIFPCFFLSCMANAGVKLAKMGHGPHSSKLVVICVFLFLFVLFYVLFVC